MEVIWGRLVKRAYFGRLASGMLQYRESKPSKTSHYHCLELPSRMLSGLSWPLSTSVKRFCSPGGRAVYSSRKCVIIITQQLPTPRSKPNNYPGTPNPLWINYPGAAAFVRSCNIYPGWAGWLVWAVVKPSGRKHIIIMAPNYPTPNLLQINYPPKSL